MRLGYTRVFTRNRDKAVQQAALNTASCDRLFEEKASGGRWDRPRLHLLLEQLQPGDVVVIWKLECLASSLKDLMLVLERIDQAGAYFQSVEEAIDTASPAGRMMMRMIGSVAAFERSQLKERTRAGLEKARKAGRVGGRKPKLSDDQKKQVITLVTSGQKSGAEVARLFHVHPATVSRLIARHRAAELDKASDPKPSAKQKKKLPKKTRSKKRSPRKTKKKAVKSIEPVLDAIGLARPDAFKDFPGAVSVLRESKIFSKMDGFAKWATSPRQFMAVADAEELICQFRREHADASIAQSYKLKDKTALEFLAEYGDERLDHRVVLQARNR